MAFWSFADNLVTGDTNGTGDIFVYDLQTSTTQRVSVATGGTQAIGYDISSTPPSISSDGRYVTFSSTARNLVTGGTDGTNIFVRDTLNQAPTDLGLSASTINENVAANTVVGNFSSTDPDTGNAFTYSLVSGTGSTDNASFSIINGNQLRINSSPDYETKSSYSVRVRTTDQGGLFFEKPLTININDIQPTITLAVSPNTVSEDGSTNLLYTLTRDDLGNSLTVNYAIAGTATNGTDYTSIGTSIIFAANSNTATITIDPTADALVETDETVALTLASGTGYTIGTTTAITGTITDDDTAIETAGNTKFIKDGTNKYFAQVGTATPIAIKYIGTQISKDFFGTDWQTLAAETVNGENQVLWKNTTENFLHLWKLDSNWNHVSSEGKWTLNSADAFNKETTFGIDANGDGLIGTVYTTIESAGNTKFVKDSGNNYFTQVGTATPIAIKLGGTQISKDFFGTAWQTLAVETVIGENQVLWKNTTENFLHLWKLDSNWNWVSSEGQWALNSTDAYNKETTFGVDANGDGLIGTVYTTIESAGNTKFVKDSGNNYFTQVGTATPIAIKLGGTQISKDFFGTAWQTLAVETVIGENQVLWKNTTENFLHLWKLDSNWNHVSSEGQWALNSTDAYNKETIFGVDANGDGVVGNPGALPSSVFNADPTTNGAQALATDSAVFFSFGTNAITRSVNDGTAGFNEASDLFAGVTPLVGTSTNRFPNLPLLR